ncbi:MAG: DUF2851 family protein [Bacteroidia bacterium]|nr:DUF2851 family protein [Bacteroidia bacterium]
MTEEFLQFVWRYQLFTPGIKKGANGEQIEIVSVGEFNSDAGPDFLNARIRIKGTLWIGNVEVHLNSSDWMKHGHQNDMAYRNVILHVVKTDDVPVLRENKEPVTTLILDYKESLEKNYRKLLLSKQWIPCAKDILIPDQFRLSFWLNSLMIERLLRKSEYIAGQLEKNANGWEETLYQQLGRNFGTKINGQPFEMLAKSLPLKYLARHKTDLVQIEAMLFGQAGFFYENLFGDEYFIRLKNEYEFLKEKFSLKPLAKYNWKYLRLRPANFPTIRIAQFASLIHCSSVLFSKLVEARSADEIRELFNVKLSGYWEDHYNFNKTSAQKKKRTGDDMINTLIINTAAPFLFLYGRFHDSGRHKDLAVNLLENLKPEKNSIVMNWQKLGIPAINAAESQALIQLKKEYCDHKKCLKCQIGNNIIAKKE